MKIHRFFEVPYLLGQTHITSELCLTANLLWSRSQSEGMKFTLPAEHNVLPCLCHQPPMTTQRQSALDSYNISYGEASPHFLSGLSPHIDQNTEIHGNSTFQLETAA